MGFLFAAAALRLLPLLLVQSLLAFSIGVTATIAAFMGTRLASSEWAALRIAIVLNGLTAAVVFAMALQKGGPTAVTAIMFTTNTTLSSLIGLIYLDDRVRDGFTAPAAVGFVLAIGGAVGVAQAATRQQA
nr:putative integral membrane protein; putative transcription factor [Kibdelosporangium sp. MJ126-NF4]CTQ95421.1 putative integral membrane protein; putative transcription factor [Kibdelosporangium sp. MJ126-NF4]